MKIVIELDSLEEHLVKFYESTDNIGLIKDALFHGYKIVNSDTYGLNLNNTNNEQNNQLKEIIVENKSLKKKNLEFENSFQELKIHQSTVVSRLLEEQKDLGL